MRTFSQLFTPKLFYTNGNFRVIWMKTVDFMKDLEWGMFFGLLVCYLATDLTVLDYMPLMVCLERSNPSHHAFITDILNSSILSYINTGSGRADAQHPAQEQPLLCGVAPQQREDHHV